MVLSKLRDVQKQFGFFGTVQCVPKGQGWSADGAEFYETFVESSKILHGIVHTSWPKFFTHSTFCALNVW